MSTFQTSKRVDVASPPPIQLVTLSSTPSSQIVPAHCDIGRDFFSAEVELAEMRNARKLLQQQQKKNQHHMNQQEQQQQQHNQPVVAQLVQHQQEDSSDYETDTTNINVHMVEIPVSTNITEANPTFLSSPVAHSTTLTNFANINRDFLEAETELMRLRLSRANNKPPITAPLRHDVLTNIPLVNALPVVDRNFVEAETHLALFRAQKLRKDHWDFPTDRDYTIAAKNLRELRFQGDDVVDRDYTTAARDRSESVRSSSSFDDRDFRQAERDLKRYRSSPKYQSAQALLVAPASTMDNQHAGLDRHFGVASADLARYRLSRPVMSAALDSPLDRPFDTAANDLAKMRKKSKPQLNHEEHHSDVDRDFNIATVDRLNFLSKKGKSDCHPSGERDFTTAAAELAKFRLNRPKPQASHSNVAIVSSDDTMATITSSVLPHSDELTVMARNILTAEKELAQLRQHRSAAKAMRTKNESSQVSQSMSYDESLDRDFTTAAIDIARHRLESATRVDGPVDRDYNSASTDLAKYRFESFQGVDRDYRSSQKDRALMDYNRSMDTHDRNFVTASLDRAKLRTTKETETPDTPTTCTEATRLDDRNYVTAARELALLRA